MRFLAVALASAATLSFSLTGAISPIGVTKAQNAAGAAAPKKLMKSEPPVVKQTDSFEEETVERVHISPVGIVLTDTEQDQRSTQTETETDADDDGDFDPSKAGFDQSDSLGADSGDDNDPTDEGIHVGLPADQGTWNFSAEPQWANGVPKVGSPSKSKIIKLTAAQEACLGGDSLMDCWQMYGSYGNRRMKAEYFNILKTLGLLNENWMSSLQVQARRLYNLTLPGTHMSAMYAEEGTPGEEGGYGVITQSLTITEQLMIGVRALDIRVSWDIANQQAMASSGTNARPLLPLLLEVQQFLEQYPTEIVMLNVRLDQDPNAAAAVAPLLALDLDTTKVPGWTFHQIMNATFGSMLINAASLSDLPNDNTTLSYPDQIQNPLVATLVDAGLNVLYFYQGQQVMCYDVAGCSSTPGYIPGNASAGIVIAPLAPGTREQRYVQNSNPQNETAVEPGCIITSSDTFKDWNPFALIRDAEEWVNSDTSQIPWIAPPCLSREVEKPTWSAPPFFFSLEIALAYNASDVAATQALLAKQPLPNYSAVFSRGEGFTQRSPAEHLNFLVLAWLMKQGWAQMYTMPNVIFVDYAMPIFVQRIIEPMQGHQDCGWAVSCVVTGSCWALSKLAGGGHCNSEGGMQLILTALQNEAAISRGNGHIYAGEFEPWVFLATIGISALIIALFCCVMPILLNLCCKQVTKTDLAKHDFCEFGDKRPEGEVEHVDPLDHGSDLKNVSEGDSAPLVPDIAPPSQGQTSAAAEP